MILVTAPELQEDGSGTKVISISLCLLLVSPLVLQMILVMAPELQEDLLGTKVKKAVLVFTYITPELQEDWIGTITGNVG